MKYQTIVIDPPWPYDKHEKGIRGQGCKGWPEFGAKGKDKRRLPLPYPSMSLDEIRALYIAGVADKDCHLFCWTTNRFLEITYPIIRGWGFRDSQLLTWCKPRRGLGPGGVFANTSEFIIYSRRGAPLPMYPTIDSTWFDFPRSGHSRKPKDFQSLIETHFPAPRAEIFATERRFGWDSFGNAIDGRDIREVLVA